MRSIVLIIFILVMCTFASFSFVLDFASTGNRGGIVVQASVFPNGSILPCGSAKHHEYVSRGMATRHCNQVTQSWASMCGVDVVEQIIWWLQQQGFSTIIEKEFANNDLQDTNSENLVGVVLLEAADSKVLAADNKVK